MNIRFRANTTRLASTSIKEHAIYPANSSFARCCDFSLATIPYGAANIEAEKRTASLSRQDAHYFHEITFTLGRVNELCS